MKKTKPLWIVLFLLLTCLLVSCKTKDNIIKIIKHNQQAGEISTNDSVDESEEPLNKPSPSENEVPLDESEEKIEIENDNMEAPKEITTEEVDWEQIYIYFDLLNYSLQESEYGDFLLFDDRLNGIDNIILYDLNKDGIPELFVEGGYESICIYSIIDKKLTLIDEIIPGSIDIMKDLNTKKEIAVISSLLEGDGGAFYLSILEMESGNMDYEILFGKFWSQDESLDEYYLNVKKSRESLDEAFMDFSSRLVSKEIYDKAMEDFENTYEMVEEVTIYSTPMYDEASFDEGLELFTEALEDYISKKY